MILKLHGLDQYKHLYLFDTFQGVPDSNLTEAERRAGFSRRLQNTSLAHVRDVLSDWTSSVTLVPGDIFVTLLEADTGLVALCHLDLNASAPNLRALEYICPRLVPATMIVMDDYGQIEYQKQRLIIDAFFADNPEKLIALPMGQGLVVKQ